VKTYYEKFDDIEKEITIMNRIQIIILWIGIAVIVVMGIFPPWMKSIQGAIKQNGYDFILAPPEIYCHINTPRLYVQWIMVAVITCGFVVTLADKKKND
jgi:hypothetical protein